MGKCRCITGGNEDFRVTPHIGSLLVLDGWPAQSRRSFHACRGKINDGFTSALVHVVLLDSSLGSATRLDGKSVGLVTDDCRKNDNPCAANVGSNALDRRSVSGA